MLVLGNVATMSGSDYSIRVSVGNCDSTLLNGYLLSSTMHGFIAADLVCIFSWGYQHNFYSVVEVVR